MESNVIVMVGLEERRDEAKVALESLGLALRTVPALGPAIVEVESLRPLGLVVPTDTPEGRQNVVVARMSRRLAERAVIGVVQDPWSPEVRSAFGVGVDDFLPADALGQLAQKFSAVRLRGTVPQPDISRQVVMVDPDPEHRRLFGRQLRRLGMDVVFANTAQEVPRTPGVTLVVCHAMLPPDGGAVALDQVRADLGRAVPWVFIGSSDELTRNRHLMGSPPMVRHLDLDSDAAQVFTVANELLRATVPAQRGSARLPVEVPVQFDVEGSWSGHWGYTYNVNAGGVFVRTLTPPPVTSRLRITVSAEPLFAGRITVPATVVWGRTFDGKQGHPPGFGAAFDPGFTERVKQLLAEAYARLARELDAAEGPDAGGPA